MAVTGQVPFEKNWNQGSSRSKRRSKPRQQRKVWHIVIISGFTLGLVCELIMTRSQIVNLHYQIEAIEYQSGKIETEKNAYYQHQAELTKLSRLKEAISEETATMESSRVFRLQ